MTSFATDAAYPLHYEAVGVANRNSANTAPENPDQALLRNRAIASHNQRARNKALLISSIKQAVADMVLASGQEARMKNSDYISRKLSHDYTYLANVFSETTGSTIKEYIIGFKIDRVKELLVADELNLTQISYKLNYSSVAHLSNQFKKVTGMAPSSYRTLHCKLGIIQKSENDANVFCNRVNASEVRRVRFAT